MTTVATPFTVDLAVKYLPPTKLYLKKDKTKPAWVVVAKITGLDIDTKLTAPMATQADAQAALLDIAAKHGLLKAVA